MEDLPLTSVSCLALGRATYLCIFTIFLTIYIIKVYLLFIISTMMGAPGPGNLLRVLMGQEGRVEMPVGAGGIDGPGSRLRWQRGLWMYVICQGWQQG